MKFKKTNFGLVILSILLISLIIFSGLAPFILIISFIYKPLSERELFKRKNYAFFFQFQDIFIYTRYHLRILNTIPFIKTFAESNDKLY